LGVDGANLGSGLIPWESIESVIFKPEESVIYLRVQNQLEAVAINLDNYNIDPKLVVSVVRENLKRFPDRGTAEQLIVKRAGRNKDDYDVLAPDGAIVGRLMKDSAAPGDAPWRWLLDPHEDRAPRFGYEPTGEAAFAAVEKAKSQETPKSQEIPKPEESGVVS